ncbi:MAG TPA: MerR family DNA-binding transcriptional regulator [Arenicellales bacterium]|nr:MerR family DNA-binding transcriptional regulator [Arenicellales bacterium]
MLHSATKTANDTGARDDESFTITQLAREFGITTRAMRFYESQGLISPARSGTTRIYSSRDRVRLKLVLRGKRLGFTLKEIANILDMYDAEPGEAGQLQYMLERLQDQRDVLEKQRDDIDLTLAELDVIESQCRQRLNSVISSK